MESDVPITAKQVVTHIYKINLQFKLEILFIILIKRLPSAQRWKTVYTYQFWVQQVLCICLLQTVIC